MTKRRCKGKTQSGKRCGNSVGPSSRYCHLHVPLSLGLTEEAALHFSRSLYYPFIEVSDEAWLKTQCLYWDSISTIVPEGMRCYQSPTAAYLRDAKILTPFYVAPDLREVREASEEALEYLDTEEGTVLLGGDSKRPARINSYKIADQLLHEVSVHQDKMSPTVARVFDTAAGKRTRRGWLRVSRGFADYYMTLLASCIARHEGYSILTQLPQPASLASRSMLGVPVDQLRRRPVPTRVAEGVLAHTILRTIAVSPRTSAKKLVKFREQHSATLGRFRTATRALLNDLRGEIYPEALQAHLETINRDQVLPAVDELKARLKDNRITCGYSNLKVSTLASASPTVLGTVLAGTAAGPFALVAGVGLSVVLSVANYRLQRRELLRSSPFSYVALAEARFGKS